jgi:hypothetical protein
MLDTLFHLPSSRKTGPIEINRRMVEDNCVGRPKLRPAIGE